jgi:hypothetical protein
VGDFSDERVRAIIDSRRQPRIYPLPGADDDSGLSIAVRLLSSEEIDDARVEAVQYTQNLARRKQVDPHELQWIDGDPHQAEVQRQQLYRALFSPDVEPGQARKPYFPSVAAIRQRDDGWVQMLYQLYLSHQRWCNPYFDLNQEQIKEAIDALKKTPDRRALLGLYDAHTLLTLADSMASQLATAPTGK